MEHLLQKNTNIFDDLQLWTTILGLLENKVKKLHWGLCFNPNSSFLKPQCESYSLTLKYTYTTLLHSTHKHWHLSFDSMKTFSIQDDECNKASKNHFWNCYTNKNLVKWIAFMKLNFSKKMYTRNVTEAPAPPFTLNKYLWRKQGNKIPFLMDNLKFCIYT